MSTLDAVTEAASPAELVASVTSAIESLATAALASATAVADEAQNITLPLGLDGSDVEQSSGNYVVNTIIGLLIVLGASVLNAFGLNLTKLDHLQNSAVPRAQRKKDYLRPLWLGGMGIYILSQVLGSPLALRYLRPDWVAPLGASSLIFNFIFAYFLVGTPVTPSDIRGTALIVLGVILILVFSSINHGLRDSLTIDELSELWRRPSWLFYFFFLTAATYGVYVVADVLCKVSKNRASFDSLPSPELPTARSFGRSSPGAGGSAIAEYWSKAKWIFRYTKGKYQHYENVVLRYMENVLSRTSEKRVQWFEGIGWAVCGGSLAGLCIIFTKAVVKLAWLPGHPFLHFVSIITVILLAITAVSQIVCLNRALEVADTVTVVPLFYAGYTVFGAINALIFYDQTGAYATWTLVFVFLSIGVLISGVVLLSMKRSEDDPTEGPQTTTTVDADPAVRLNPRQPTDGGESGGVLWTVGEDEDADSDDDETKKEGQGQGVGGTHVEGERGGLLLVHDDDDRLPSPNRRPSRRLEDEEEAEFGPFASPMRSTP